MDFSLAWKELGHYRLPLSVTCEGKSFSVSCHQINPKSVLQIGSSFLPRKSQSCISQLSPYGLLRLALKIAITTFALGFYEEQNVLFVHVCAEAVCTAEA